MTERWTKEKAWAWYNQRPWMRGCNYMSADCANRIDQWQALDFDKRLETTDKELALAEELGFNSIRIIVEFAVWHEEHDSFFERFDRYLDVCKKHGISCMVVLANDCMPPKYEGYEPPHVGKQKFDWGYHGGRKKSQHSIFSNLGYHPYFDEPEMRPLYFEMVREIIERYKNDERICVWDLYNEPGNSNRDSVTLPNIAEMFRVAREINPSQPLTASVWKTEGVEPSEMLESEKFALENSDIITYHCYNDYAEQVKVISRLRALGRPLMNTEWLKRPKDNNIEDTFPLFFLEKIGSYIWGFVAGLYQTYEPHEAVWQIYEKDHDYKFDFTKWFHDLYRPNHRPYNPKETELIHDFCVLADKEFEKNNK